MKPSYVPEIPSIDARFRPWITVLGDRWALWILATVPDSGARFADLVSEDGLSRRVLTERLRQLEHVGLIERELYSDRPPRYRYRPTKRGVLVRDGALEMLARATRADVPSADAASVPGSEAASSQTVPAHPADRMLLADLDYADEVYRECIESIFRYDREYRAQLIETLRVYLDAEASVSVAAVRIHAHRHTVRYRLGRIQELCGLDVDALGDRERLILGLRAAAILDRSGRLNR